MAQSPPVNHNLVKALLVALAVFGLVAALAAEKTAVPDKLAEKVAAPEKDAQAATYRAGADWEAFLGSGGDSKSTETGIL
ncbi:MAG: hypothetical protein O7A98_08620, partial [Acidobacteria bacterium]|nr:hypothetical protein [Acidobacteriota bacterium]